MTGSSVFALLSFGLQDTLLGTKFNWTAPSVFSGVSCFFECFKPTGRLVSYPSFFPYQFLFLGVAGLAYMSRTKLAAAKAMTGERKRYIKGILII